MHDEQKFILGLFSLSQVPTLKYHHPQTIKYLFSFPPSGQMVGWTCCLGESILFPTLRCRADLLSWRGKLHRFLCLAV